TDMRELHAIRRFLCLPHMPVESDRPAVQRVSPIVNRNLIRLPVDRELSQGDPVSKPSHDATEMRLFPVQVIVQLVESQHDVRNLAVPVGRSDAHNPGAIGRDSNLYLSACQGKNRNGSPIRRMTPYRHIDFSSRQPPQPAGKLFSPVRADPPALAAPFSPFAEK